MNPPKICPGCLKAEIAKSSLWCRDCWRTVPPSLNAMFRKPALRGAAIGKINDHFRRRREEPSLF